MPYIKTQAAPWAAMTRLLRGYGVTPTGLSVMLDVSRPTATKRLMQPGTLTLDELHTISRRAHIPMEEIRGAVVR
ncbi:MAG: hypothetical protein J6T26_07780 [Firmicutes bacterium]|nr:hypothetical protein [Bacillota bacterium]